MNPPYRKAGKWLSGTALLCLALAACNKAPQGDQPVTGAPIAALQLATAAPPPPTYAPDAAALPPAPRPIAYRPEPEHWRYLTDAYDMSDAFADTPPDYTVGYEGEDPYVWRADDGAYRVVEWLPDGARYYYYEPGADEPFLIQDPEYSYAYNDGALVAVYTLAGALVADRLAAERVSYAARYYTRGHDLYRAAQQDRRRAAYADNWRARAPMIQAQRERWQRGRQEQRGWQDWNRAHQAQQEGRWAGERQRRATYAAALAKANRDIATHRPDRGEAQRAAEARPAPQPTGDAARGARLPLPGNRPDVAERHAEADRVRPRLFPNANPPAQAHGANLAREKRNAADVRQPQPDLRGVHSAQERLAARKAEGHAAVAQRREAQQPRQTQQQELQRADQAQRHTLQQAQQLQHHEARQAAEVQRPHVQAQVQQARQPQHAAIEARPAPNRPEASRPQPQHVEARPAGPPPRGGGQPADHHHH